MEQMEKSGCRVGDNFVKAVVCTGPVAGGFTRGKGVKIASMYALKLLDLFMLMLSSFLFSMFQDHCVQ